MNLLSYFWLSAASFFEPVQYFFNGSFWQVFTEQFGKFEKKKVLDLACGTGEINKFIRPSRYLGVDINKFYIDYANKKFKKKNTSFKLKDVTAINFLEKFDTAFLISAAHHLSDRQINLLFKSVRRSGAKNFIIVDALPKGWSAKILKWLDASLGGGKYFRSLDKLELLVKNKGRVVRRGQFRARRSFYIYYFLEIRL